jgi:hypothetical protein
MRRNWDTSSHVLQWLYVKGIRLARVQAPISGEQKIAVFIGRDTSAFEITMFGY